MEQKFSNNSIDLQMLREFCEREGELVEYRKGDQMEREGEIYSFLHGFRPKNLFSSKIYCIFDG